MPTALGPLVPRDAEKKLARRAHSQLARLGQTRGDDPVRVRLEDSDGKEFVVTLPSTAVRMLRSVLAVMASGNAVTLVTHGADLTTGQAAEVLRVSRPYLMQLLDEGTIPFHMVRARRCVRLLDAIAYRQELDLAREKSLDELTAIGQELERDEPTPEE